LFYDFFCREKRQAEEDAVELEKQNNLEAERAAHLLKIMTEAEQKLAYEKVYKCFSFPKPGHNIHICLFKAMLKQESSLYLPYCVLYILCI
jgi:hypothetical protein